jgi:nitrogen fixation NifU-like protein
MKESTLSQGTNIDQSKAGGEFQMLADLGYSPKAIQYFLEKPYMGDLPDADQISEMIGSCGDTMKIFLKIEKNIISDARYQVLGCPGAISAAMAAVDIIKGKSIDFARTINDGDVYKKLEEIPAKKHHCIQLAVKTLYKALDEYMQPPAAIKGQRPDCRPICPGKENCYKNEGSNPSKTGLSTVAKAVS